jgi:hypothetical protein
MNQVNVATHSRRGCPCPTEWNAALRVHGIQQIVQGCASDRFQKSEPSRRTSRIAVNLSQTAWGGVLHPAQPLLIDPLERVRSGVFLGNKGLEYRRDEPLVGAVQGTWPWRVFQGVSWVGIPRGFGGTWWYSRKWVSTSIVYLKFIYSPVTSSLSAENTIKDQLSSWGKKVTWRNWQR